jgi:RND family efflux transporter MFP subunit
MTGRPAAVATALALAGLGHAGCARQGEGSVGRAPVAVRMVVVELSGRPEPTSYSAIIAPDVQVDLAFRVPGYVAYLQQTRGADGRIRPLEAGSAVTSGTTLARLRAADYQAAVDKARGARDEADAGVRAAKAQAAEAEAGLAQAELDFGRNEALWREDSITKPAYDASKAGLDASRAKVDAARAAVAAARPRAASASAQLKEAEIALGDTDLRSPFDGILLERRVEVGTLAAAGTSAFTVADLRLVKARFNVPDTALHDFRNGQWLALTIDAFGDEKFEGRVLSVAAAADPRARSFEINVAMENPDLKLRSGMIASIRVAESGAEQSLPQIPIDAVVHDPTADRYLAYTTEQRNGRAVVKAIAIRPGPLAGNHVLVLEGLSAGQRIIASGANLLRPGEAVTEVE